MPALLLVLCVLSFSFQSLFTKLFNDHFRGPAGTAEPVFSVTYGIVIALTTLITGAFRFAPSGLTVLFGLLNALMLILYNMAIIRAGSLGSYSFMMIANMFGGILLPVFTGVLFLGETVSVTGIIAVAMMLAAMVLLNCGGASVKTAKKGYYLWCILLFLANGLYGAFLNIQATLMNGLERTEMLVILFLCSSLFTIVCEAVKGRLPSVARGYRMGVGSGVYLALCCIFAAAGANLLLYLFSVMNTDVVCTVDDGGVLVLSILYSLILFKEKPAKLQWLGMALAVASIVLINL
ncbi:MAG: DMT family transporter [Clostridia bacterium]|nr:DMT family transporter [Clostridia bacterium]